MVFRLGRTLNGATAVCVHGALVGQRVNLIGFQQNSEFWFQKAGSK